jgi:pimeloyl-ACP methyl ester carboxylesterase
MGLTSSQLLRKYVEIEMDGKPFQVRVVTINEHEKGKKKTLVMHHGMFGASVVHMRILKDLADHYHVVLFDQVCWGLNTRDGKDSSSTQGPEAAE